MLGTGYLENIKIKENKNFSGKMNKEILEIYECAKEIEQKY